MLGDAMQPVVSYRTTVNFVWLVYLGQAFVATIEPHSRFHYLNRFEFELTGAECSLRLFLLA